MGETLEKLGGSVMNLVLGALIVWVGQTTFQHAGILASLDEKLASVDKNFEEVEKRQEALKKWTDSAITELKDDSRSQFTAKEGDKLVSQIRQVEDATLELERQLDDRLSDLEVRLVSLAATGQNSQQVAALQAELAQLRLAKTQALGSAEPQYQTAYPAQTNMSQQPVYLPPVTSRR
jgi:hypothetical protein